MLQKLSHPFWFGSPDVAGNLPSQQLQLSNSTAITTAGHKLSFGGYITLPDKSTDDSVYLDNIEFRFGTITVGTSSDLKISIQNPNPSGTSNIVTPDGTPIVYRVLSTSGKTSNSWESGLGRLTTDGTDGGNRLAVSHGDFFCIVIEFNGTPSAASFTTSNVNASYALHPGGIAHYNGSSWAAITHLTNMVFNLNTSQTGAGSSAGVATFAGCFPMTATAALSAIGSGSTPDEYGNRFTVPFPMKVDAWRVHAYANLASADDFDIVLYEGTTQLAATSLDANYFNAATRISLGMFPEPVLLLPGTTYYLAFKPTTTNTLSLYYSDVNAAAHLSLVSFSDGLYERTDAGSWSLTSATRAMILSMRCSHLPGNAMPIYGLGI